MSPRFLPLQPSAPPAAFSFHAYAPPSPPPPAAAAAPEPRRRPSSAPFPTFLYADQPPPVTPRNKQRVRPSADQLADLKALYAATPHPTREEREGLGRRIGMRYQSVTNWFQNQRSTAKKRTPPPMPAAAAAAAAVPRPPPRTDPVRDIIAQASARPPRLPLPLSGAAIVPTLCHPVPLLPPPPAHHPLLSSFQVARPATPAAAAAASPDPRGRRSRPTPHQLAALRALHAATTSPSIEERVRVGREIGMELGKVTNWFRNLRQTARKKERRALQPAPKRPASPGGGGAARKRPRWDDDDSDGDGDAHGTSELGTESDAAHEAVTPEPPPARGPDEKPRAASVDDALLLLALHDAAR